MYYCIILLLFCSNLCYGFERVWTVGGDIELRLQSDSSFDINEREKVQLSAHLPGFQETPPLHPQSYLQIVHTYSNKNSLQLIQNEGKVEIYSNWSSQLPQDLIHLLYGACRLEWLKRGIFTAHAACIGNEEDGYSLLIGSSGSGKTSLTMHNAVHHGFKIFSGDKTLLSFNDKGELEAIAGTHTITVRGEDIPRWASVPKTYAFPLGDRQAFQLSSDSYAQSHKVPIKQIFIIGLNDHPLFDSEISPLSALHELYPFFLDRQREDTLVGADQGFFNGAVAQELKESLVKKLHASLQKIPVYRVKGNLEEVTAFIHSKCRKPPKKILFGVCGIGNGHCNRQLPVLSHLLDQGHQIMVFTYGEGLSFFKDRFPFRSNLTVIPVANPYYVGCLKGLDFEKTALSEKNQVDFNKINALAMFRATQELGCPDLVISDYEMVAAQYAYAKQAPLVTLDQQSKYLVGHFETNLHGTSYLDEIERLNLFFPVACKRIAVSFFQVKSDSSQVDIVAPMVRPEIIREKGNPRSATPSLIVYVTSQQIGSQPIDQWIDTIRTALPTTWEAHIFLPKRLNLPLDENHLHFYHHGNPIFDKLFISSHGVISTAGHTLLSEAMYLEKPVYALPLPLYEQQLNAHVIAEGGFGLSEETLTPVGITTFIENLEFYTENIRQDEQWLIKEPGNTLIIQKIEEILWQ